MLRDVSFSVMFGDMSNSECVMVTGYAAEALHAIWALSTVAPDIETRLRIQSGGRDFVLALRVRRGKWICPGVSKLQQEAA
jgi:hypothetical protein